MRKFGGNSRGRARWEAARPQVFAWFRSLSRTICRTSPSLPSRFNRRRPGKSPQLAQAACSRDAPSPQRGRPRKARPRGGRRRAPARSTQGRPTPARRRARGAEFRALQPAARSLSALGAAARKAPAAPLRKALYRACPPACAAGGRGVK